MRNLICFVFALLLMVVCLPQEAKADHCRGGACGVGRAALHVASAPFRGARQRRENGNRGLLGLRRG